MQTKSSRVDMAKQGTIALKMVAPVIPRGAKEKAMLEEDLKRMRCHGLMLRLWSIKYEKIVQELQQKQSNQWAGTIRWDPNFGLQLSGGRCMASQSGEKAWQHEQRGLQRVNLPTRVTPKMAIHYRNARIREQDGCWSL